MRESFFAEHCGADEDLRREVESLFSFENSSEFRKYTALYKSCMKKFIILTGGAIVILISGFFAYRTFFRMRCSAPSISISANWMRRRQLNFVKARAITRGSSA